jgi:CubicO group peptidase (beta-lactamase class C family)
MQTIRLLVVLIFALNSVQSISQNSYQKIDSFFSVLFKGKFNGGLLMAEDDKVIYENSFGKSDFRKGLENKLNTRFNLASVSKPITATAVLQLVEKGKIRLGDPLKRYLPNFPFSTITIQHLLTHTSGLPNLELYEEIVQSFPDSVISNTSIIPALQRWRQPLAFQPGDKWQYCNTNYDLLALLIERVSGLSYSNYLQKNIFKPSGMQHSHVRYTTKEEETAIAHVFPTWYTDVYVPADSVSRFRYINYNLSGLVGSTNIITTTSDMLLFDKAFFSGKLLKKYLVELALTPVKLSDGSIFEEGSMDTMLGEGKGSYGMGWSLYDQPVFGKSVGHGGFNYGLATFYFHNLDKKQTIVAYDNTAGSSFGKVVTSALRLLNGQNGVRRPDKTSLARIYGTVLKTKGPDEAITIFNDLKTDSVNYYIDEREFNWLGYDLLRADFNQLAIEVFKINTILFPKSFNVYDSFAEALLKTGKKEEAILMYKKSLLLNPNNEGAKEMLKRIDKTN